MPTFTTTAKHALRRLTGANVGSDIDAGFSALADDLDAIIARADQGPAGSRPTSTGGTPGKLGRFYWATDTLVLSFDYGTGWITVYEDQAWHVVGASGQPAYSSGASGQAKFYRSNGRVYLAGTLAITAANGLAFTLPAGYRPANTAFFVQYSTQASDGTRRVEISNNGVVYAANVGNFTDVLHLDGIDFRAEL